MKEKQEFADQLIKNLENNLQKSDLLPVERFYMFGYQTNPGTDQKGWRRNDRFWRQISHKNKEIDHVIWHYLASGRSEYSDVEAAVRKMKVILGTNDETKQREEFQKLQRAMQNDQLYKDIGTIQEGMEDLYTSLARAFFTVGCSSWDWDKLLSFIEHNRHQGELNLNGLDILYYCASGDGFNQHLYLKAIRLFLQWRTGLNFTHEEKYWRFLSVYVDFISIYGFEDSGNCVDLIESNVPNDIKAISEDVIDQIHEWLQIYRDQILRKKQKFISMHLQQAADDLDLIIQFLERNDSILTSRTFYKAKPLWRVEVTSPPETHTDDELYRHLKKSHTDDELNEAYKSGRITMQELNSILRDDSRNDMFADLGT